MGKSDAAAVGDMLCGLFGTSSAVKVNEGGALRFMKIGRGSAFIEFRVVHYNVKQLRSGSAEIVVSNFCEGLSAEVGEMLVGLSDAGGLSGGLSTGLSRRIVIFSWMDGFVFMRVYRLSGGEMKDLGVGLTLRVRRIKRDGVLRRFRMKKKGVYEEMK